MIFSVQKFHHYLLGNFFVFYVDHQALLYLINKVVIQGRLARWMLLLQEFDFKVIHKPGKCHFGANFLSRETPKGETTSIQSNLPDAALFQIEMDIEGSEIASYLRTGEFPMGWSMRQKKALILRARNYTWVTSALYRLERDGVLRRCVRLSEREGLLKEAHEGEAGGHMAGETTARRCFRLAIGGTQCLKISKNERKAVMCVRGQENHYPVRWGHYMVFNHWLHHEMGDQLHGTIQKHGEA